MQGAARGIESSRRGAVSAAFAIMRIYELVCFRLLHRSGCSYRSLDMACGPQPNQPSAMPYKMARLQAGANLTQESQGIPTPPVLGGETTPPPLPKPKSSPPPNDDERFKPKSDWQVPSQKT